MLDRFLASGVASLAVTALPTGNNKLTLSYSGDSNFLASSTTVTVTANVSILVLDPTANSALSLSSNATINVPGTVIVDSNSNSALNASGNAVVKAASIQVVGKVQKSGNPSLSPTPVTGAAAVADPLAHLAAPSPSGLTNYGAVNISGSSVQTLKPGIYSQISISSGASVTLDPGIYIIEGGGFTVSGNANLTGTGILIYNTGSKYPTYGGSYGAITLSGNGTIKLSAATTGTYAGIAIDQDPNNTQTLTLSGTALAVTGTVYASKAQLVLSGGAQLNGTLDVDQLTMSGNAVDNGGNAPPPGPGGDAGDSQVATSPIALSTIPFAWQGVAADRNSGLRSLDSWFGLLGETPELLTSTSRSTPIASHSLPRGDADSQRDNWLCNRLDDSLLDQLAPDNVV
jgi:hypothetical protein